MTWLEAASSGTESLEEETSGICFLRILPLVFILIVKIVPFPKMLSTLTSPPIFSIILLQILNPKPVPCALIFECSSSLPNSMNSFDRFSLLIPTPESIISIFSLTNFSYPSYWLWLSINAFSDGTSNWTSCYDFFIYFLNSFWNFLFVTASLISFLCFISSSMIYFMRHFFASLAMSCISKMVTATWTVPPLRVNFTAFDRKF